MRGLGPPEAEGRGAVIPEGMDVDSYWVCVSNCVFGFSVLKD